MDTIDIIIDSREQTPWSFQTYLATTRVEKIDAGDYALVGDDKFSIERKSLDDFAGTVSTGWERFERELDRMGEFVSQVIVVEARFLDYCFWELKDDEGKAVDLIPPIHNHSRITPQFMMLQTATLALRGVSVLFAENAEVASALGYAILKARADQLREES